MNVLHFADLNGQHCRISGEALIRDEVESHLRTGERLTGLDDPPRTSSRGSDDGYGWRIQETSDGEALEYVVSTAQLVSNRVILLTQWSSLEQPFCWVRGQLTIRIHATRGRR